ncbi:NADPH dehydrogenase [Camillea tinctor]|nr:NADPH dehydrogenase [Camillea tinctor]
MSPIKNEGAPNSPYFTPAQDPPAGTALDPATAPTLFQPLKIRGMTLQNRFAVSPMCQYSADNGHLTDWHFAHLSQFIIRGAGLTIVEATSVTPNGRISPEDSGLWQDSQIAPLKRIADFAHAQGQKLGVQLDHAGRKASTLAPWLVTSRNTPRLASEAARGWPDDIWAASAISYADGYPDPRAMTLEEIASLVGAWRDAARRALAAGVDCIEIHGAHGYLISGFLSPQTNRRTDAYGGSFENRTRLLFEVIAAVREVVPADFPLLLRISATEWMEHLGPDQPTWDLAESVRLAKLLPAAGVDLLDVSSGGLQAGQRIHLHPYYQINLAGEIRAAIAKEGLNLLIGAVGMVTDAEMARSIVQESGRAATSGDADRAVEIAAEDAAGQVTYADLVLVGRQFLREPEFPLRVAQQLGVEVKWPVQYHRAGWPKGAKI